jgi:exosome complex component RRP42
LSIISGKKCWNVYVDIVVLEFSGNLCDSCVLAVKFALSKSELPKLVVRSDDEGQQEIDVVDDPFAIIKLNTDNVPYAISVCKIGHNFLIDADLKEESVSKVKLIYGFDTNGFLKFTFKEGFGSLDPETLYSMTDVSVLKKS